MLCDAAGAFLANCPALYWETTHGAGGHVEYGAAMRRLMAHCGLLEHAGVPAAVAIGEEVSSQGGTVRRMHHENLGHGAGLMSSHNQFPVSGLWRPQKSLWDIIEEGEVLGSVVNVFGEVQAEVVAEHSGTVVSLLPMQHVPAGVSAGIIL